MSDTYKDHGHPPGWENEHDPRCQACAQSELASSNCSPSWVCKPNTEGWWWSGAHREWVEVSSTDLVEAHVSNSWDGPWWGPIYPPEVPTGMMENTKISDD
jgi:hypothetical protein